MHHEETKKAVEKLTSQVKELTEALRNSPGVPADGAGVTSSRRRTRVRDTASSHQEEQQETPKWKMLMQKLPMPLPLRSKKELVDLHRHLGGTNGEQAKAHVRAFLLEIARVSNPIPSSYKRSLSGFSVMNVVHETDERRCSVFCHQANLRASKSTGTRSDNSLVQCVTAALLDRYCLVPQMSFRDKVYILN
jgi:hypothetical protein